MIFSGVKSQRPPDSAIRSEKQAAAAVQAVIVSRDGKEIDSLCTVSAAAAGPVALVLS